MAPCATASRRAPRPKSFLTNAHTHSPQVTSIHALSTDTTSDWTALLQQLRQQENNLPRAGPPLRGALDALDPARHTLGYIFLLYVARCHTAASPARLVCAD
jgi:hypothetical protein